MKYLILLLALTGCSPTKVGPSNTGNGKIHYCVQVNAGAGGYGVACCNEAHIGMPCGVRLEQCSGTIKKIYCAHNVTEESVE